MGDIAVDIFQETLKQLITSSKISLITEEKQQLQSLQEEIKYLRGFLKVTEKKRNDHSEVRNLVKHIREQVAEAENIVELFVACAFKADHAPYLLREHEGYLSRDLETVKKGMKNLTVEVREMGDIAIDIFQETLKELITSSELSLIIKEKHQLQSLEEEIKYLRGFLKHTEKKRNDHPEVMKLVMQIRDLVAEAENIVELFVVHAFKADHLPIRKKKNKKQHHLQLSSVKERMKTLTSEAKKIYEEEVNRLINKLDDRGEGRPLEIISIIGAGGDGKTTLAREVYDHPFTSYTFEIRAWIDVSQDYNMTRKRDLLIRILELVTRRDCENISDDKLGEDVHQCLKGKKYLIVMDDIWGIEAWNDIQISFPKECKGSKVLFTSRLLVQLDSVGYFPYYFASLPKKWCSELLQKKGLKNIVVHAFKADHVPYSLREHEDHLSLDFRTIKKGMKNLTAEVKKTYDENMYDINGVGVKQIGHYSTGIGGGSGSSRGSNTSKMVREKVVVGFEEEVRRLIDKLGDRGKGRPLEIISIIGAGGGGKTTLAREVYDDPFTLYTFEIRVWIDVSQDYDKTRKRDLLIRISESVIPGNYKSSDDKLGEEIHKCLKGKRYLIVMDDIWGTEAWNDIQRSFPKEYKGSKVLFTSRRLVQPDSIEFFPHRLDPLQKKICWELLQKKVFGMKCCPSELVDIGKQIAEKCKGLPLAVVTIAGFLATEDKILDVWEKVAKHLSSIIAKNHEGCMEILELSYNHLPLHLKACFLYIGGYPEDREIPIRELIWLWIAEGFIQQSEGEKSLETIAEGYLIDLVDRSLVQVARKSSLGGIKACCIHDLLRELCLKKAEEDNFLVKVDGYDSFSPSATNKHRRLFIGDKCFQKLSLMPRNLRSFLCLMRERYRPRVWNNLPFFVEDFELLRVLHFLPVSCFGETGIRHLVHLRYLAIKNLWSFNAIPFSYLLNLETLKIHNLGGVKLPHDIFKMVKLRHLYTKDAVFTFCHLSKEARRKDFERSSMLDSLQTFSQVCACEDCQCFLIRTPNLRKLGLYARLIKKDMGLSFPDLEFLECLEKLTFTVESPKYMLVTLPPRLKLPLTIVQITLKYTRLKWEKLSLLQTLPKLEVLKLLMDACDGPVWDASELDVGLLQLKYLKFKILDIEEWNAYEEQFPKLEVLVIERCYKLKHIPIAFGNLDELREIKLVRYTRSVKESARQIREERINRNGDGDCLNLISVLPIYG